MKKKRRGTVYKTEKKQREYASTNMAAEAHMHADTTGEIKELSSSECPSSHSPPSYFFSLDTNSRSQQQRRVKKHGSWFHA